jgi:hypothetical protein
VRRSGSPPIGARKASIARGQLVEEDQAAARSGFDLLEHWLNQTSAIQ